MKYVPYYIKDGKFADKIDGHEVYGIDDPYKRGGEQKFYIHEDMSADSIKSMTNAGYTVKKIPAKLHDNMFGCSSCGNRSAFEFDVAFELEVQISSSGDLMVSDASEIINALLNRYKGAEQLAVMNLLSIISKHNPIPTDPNEKYVCTYKCNKNTNYENVDVFDTVERIFDTDSGLVTEAAEKNLLNVSCCACGGEVVDYTVESGYTEVVHSGHIGDESDMHECGGCAICSKSILSESEILDRCAQCIGYDFTSHLEYQEEIKGTDEEDENWDSGNDLSVYLDRYHGWGLCGDRDCVNLEHVIFYGCDQFSTDQYKAIYGYADEIKSTEDADIHMAETIEEIVDG